jgi:hypothetical protein
LSERASEQASPSQQVVNGPFKIIPHSKTSKKTLSSFYYSFPRPPIHPGSKAFNNFIMLSQQYHDFLKTYLVTIPVSTSISN